MKEALRSMALSALAYFRTVVTVTSLIAWVQKEWVGFFLSLAVFAVTTILLTNILAFPSKQELKDLTKAINLLREQEEKQHD